MSVIVLTAIDKRHDLALYDIDNKAWVDIVFDRDSHRFEPTADGKPVPFVTGIDDADAEAWEGHVREEADRKGIVLGTFFPGEPDPESEWDKEGWYFSIECVKIMP